jgi:hypothetical protein
MNNESFFCWKHNLFEFALVRWCVLDGIFFFFLSLLLCTQIITDEIVLNKWNGHIVWFARQLRWREWETIMMIRANRWWGMGTLFS